jgi:hypothetical protein
MEKTVSDIQLKISVLILCMLPAIASADIYRWTDETGKTHYSDKAPPGVKAEKKEYVNVATPWRKVPKPASSQEAVEADEALISDIPGDSAKSNGSEPVNAKVDRQGELLTDKKDKKKNRKGKEYATRQERITDIKERNAQAIKDYRTSD